MQVYKLWPKNSSRSVRNCILQTRPATGIARRIWIAELHAGLEKVRSAGDTAAVALLFHQLCPTSTAHCYSVSAALWGIPRVPNVDVTKGRFTSRPSDFSTLGMCGAMSGPNYEVGEPPHNPSFPPLTLLLLCSMQF